MYVMYVMYINIYDYYTLYILHTQMHVIVTVAICSEQKSRREKLMCVRIITLARKTICWKNIAAYIEALNYDYDDYRDDLGATGTTCTLSLFLRSLSLLNQDDCFCV